MKKTKLKYIAAITIVTAVTVVTVNNNIIAKSLTTIVNNDKVYDKVDEMPKFKGGEKALNKYLKENINYPKEAVFGMKEGVVLIRCVINSKGEVENVKVLKSAGSLLDEEAVRVVKNMPKWKPGKHEGKKVSVNYNIPVNFKLGDNIPVISPK